jgi:hypothetical protein
VLLSVSKSLRNAIVPSPEYVAAKIAFGNKLAMALFGARSETLMNASSDKPPPPRDSSEAEASTTPIPKRLIELAKKLQKLIDRQKQSDEKRR